MGSREIDSPKVENEGPLGIPAAYERVPFSIGEVFNFHPVLTRGGDWPRVSQARTFRMLLRSLTSAPPLLEGTTLMQFLAADSGEV
jgi:hypothetical protein